jgi:hypothetical protein
VLVLAPQTKGIGCRSNCIMDNQSNSGDIPCLRFSIVDDGINRRR